LRYCISLSRSFRTKEGSGEIESNLAYAGLNSAHVGN